MSISNFINKAFVTLFPETWCCALRINKGSETIFTDKETPFTVLNDNKRFWTADPFLFKNNEKVYLFFEAFDRLKRKGVLGFREITGGVCGDINIIFESDTHLSYPFIYEDSGEIYIIPESNKSSELYRLKCKSFPYEWEREKLLLNEKLADTTRFVFDNTVYYLSEKADDSNTFDRLDLYYEDNGVLIECSSNPVKRDSCSARCAGKVFMHNGQYIRPSQNCGEAYGKELNFNKIISISKNEYKEEKIETVANNQIKTNVSKSFVGIHTYNKLDNIEVIDLKISRKFNFYNFIGIFYKLFKRVFK